MKKPIIALLILLIAAGLCACSTDTYSRQSTSRDFVLKNVSSVTVSGPDSEGGENIEMELTATGSADYTRLVTLVQGRKREECPTDNFGLCVLNFAITTGETIKAYPANDGSPYICLYSLNPRQAKYLELSREAMDEVTRIFEKYGITVVYE